MAWQDAANTSALKTCISGLLIGVTSHVHQFVFAEYQHPSSSAMASPFVGTYVLTIAVFKLLRTFHRMTPSNGHNRLNAM